MEMLVCIASNYQFDNRGQLPKNENELNSKINI